MVYGYRSRHRKGSNDLHAVGELLDMMEMLLAQHRDLDDRFDLQLRKVAFVTAQNERLRDEIETLRKGSEAQVIEVAAPKLSGQAAEIAGMSALSATNYL